MIQLKDLWGLAVNEAMVELLTQCSCRAADARVCWMIRYGEHPDRNPRCSCACHQPKENLK